MALDEYAELLGTQLVSAIERKGYDDLTAVQRAVLDPALEGRDLRITSQTGSGKTVAIGLTLRTLIGQETAAQSGVARPRALVVAPTRELAHQVEQELVWLYAGSAIRLATTTGGASYRDEHRALSRGPAIVVATPGRLLDHLNRGSVDPSQVATIVLDEADRMLDLGFRDDLLAIFAVLPKERRTHLVSATFPRMVRALADKVQNEPAHVEGTRLGAANVDIDHVIHVVDPHQRLDALINLLLANPDDQTLVFVRTRADAAHIANELVMSGFAASGLSGEMDQAARNRALTAFRQGGLRVLIATDVAARGIDVQNVSRVVHAELPTNADAYTHRSGRTGRAGRKGTSSLLIAPAAVVRATRLLRGLGVQHRVEAIPSADQINAAGDRRLLAALTVEPGRPGERDEATEPSQQDDSKLQRWQPLAAKLIEAGEIERTLTRLLARTGAGVTEPRNVRVFAERPRREPLPARPPARGPNGELRQRNRGDSGPREGGRRDYEPRASGGERSYEPRASAGGHEPRASAGGEPQRDQERRAPRPYARDDSTPQPRSNDREAAGSGAASGGAEGGFTRFRVSWGRQRGADARRLLAMVCRRGQIRGRDVGAIRVEAISSIVEVADAVAADFARAAAVTDPREPNVVIRRAGASEAMEESRDGAAERHARPSAPRAPRKAGGAKSLLRPNRA